MQHLKKAFTAFTVFATILWSLGLSLFPIALPIAKAAAGDITGVALADTDSVSPNIPSPGLDGRDFNITWVPDPATPTGPSGYMGTKIFIVPNGVSLTAGNVLVNGCGGSACQDRGFLNQYQANMFIVPDFFKADSANNPFTVQAYKACVLIDATTDQLACSSAMTPTSDSVTDTNRPFVQHTPVISATASANAIINAIIRDDQSTAADFINGTTGAAIRLFYGTNLSLSSASSTAVQVISGAGDLFQFTVPSATVGASGTFQYYIKATDKANNTAFTCANPNPASDADCTSSPFVVNVVTAGARSIAGTIRSGGDALADAKVFIGGYAKVAATTDGAGAYSVTGLPDNNSFEITAYKNGYCDNKRFEFLGSAPLTGMDLNLNAGDCSFVAPPTGGGTYNSGGKPHVVFSGPPDNMTFVSISEKIRVGFDQALNGSTVNDSDASDAGSKVYLTTNGSDQVAGTVTYCANQSSVGCSTIFPQDQNVILFTPTSSLAQNIFYTLVITEGVTSSSGQSVEGNRSGGGHQIRFTTGGDTFNFSDNPDQYGAGGASMPPYVQSMSPGPGIQAAPNIKPLISFNQGMNTTTLTTTNIKLVKKSDNSNITITVTPDGNTGETATITPSASLALGDYEIRVLGAVANNQGVTMRAPNEGTSVAFSGFFTVSGSADTTPPSIFPAIIDGSTGVAVNKGALQYGFSKQLDPTTATTSTITMARGSTSVPASVEYRAGENNLYVIPTTILANSTAYSVTFGTGVKDLYGNAFASARTFSFTTGSADTTAPKIIEARCDEYSCNVKFNEPMNSKVQADGATSFAASVLNRTNITLATGTSAVTKEGATDLVNASSTAITLSYDPVGFGMKVQGFSTGQLTIGGDFALRIEQEAADLASNALGNTGNVIIGKVEDSKQTFGTFGGEGGMFGPPTTSFGGTGATTGGFAFTPEGFGNFTAEQASFGDATSAFPFNQMASADVNVFQVRFKPDVALLDDDLIEITFPTGTGIANAAPDNFSPFKNDMNESFGAGTVTFDTTYDSDGVSVDESSSAVTAKLSITGTPGATDQYTVDLRKITNPAIPKGPDTGGIHRIYKVKRGTSTIATKTSMPYFINQGGSRSITVKVYAGTSGTGTSGANGTLFLHGGGPGGPMDKNLTLTDGKITAADGVSIANDAGVVYSSLPDGCYFLGTEPFVSLGGNDYFGQMSPEPICVNSSNSSPTKNIVLSSASASGASLAVTVKITGAATLGGSDVDIFAGGPGRFVVKNLTSVGTPESAGYTLRLPSTGQWFIGMGPGMPKGASTSTPKSLPCNPPSPVDIKVVSLGASGAMATGFQTPKGVTVDAANKTITFSCTTADKAISGTVNDGTTGLANVHINMHSQGFGAATFAQTKSDGTFSLNVGDHGSYELCAFKDGLPPNCNHIEVQPDGSDAGTDIDIFFKGKQITGSNPLVIRMKKGAYTISGKILDSSSNAISYAPVFAEDTANNFVNGGSSQDGSYTLFVDAGTWTVRSMLPPDKTDACGTFSKIVTVTTANQANQNISPSTGTCYTLSGTVTVGGSTLANAPVFIAEWDTGNSRPAAAGVFRPTSTNSSGVYSAQVAGNKTYRVGTFSQDYGEISTTKAVTTSNITDADINSGTLGTVTFAFTGGTATQEALLELKSATDQFKRITKSQKGLNTNATFSVSSGTYNYFVNVAGIGQYTGVVATGATATIDLSATNMVTLSGNINDGSGTDITGALVTLKGSDGTIATATADASGNYSATVKAGTYSVSAANAGYLPPQGATVTLTSSTSNYDWGGASPDQTALKKSDQVISGTIYKSNGTTPVTDGFVQAENTATGAIIIAPIGSDGTYSLPVDDGTYQVKAATSGHAKTALSSNVTLAGTTDSTAKNITLTADATKTSSATTESISASVGGSVDDTDTTKIKLTAGAGVLDTGSGNVTLTFEQTFTAPDTTTLKPLGDALFSITADSSGTAVKETKGNVEETFDYEHLLSKLPVGVSESDLKLTHKKDDTYVPVEGGFTIDTTNNKITGQTDHFTDFAIVYSPVGSTPTVTGTTGGTTSPGTISGGSSGGSSTVEDLQNKPVVKTPEKPIAYAPSAPQKSAAILQIERILSEAKVLIKGSIDDVVKLVNAKRDTSLEKKFASIVNKVVGKTKLSSAERTTIDAFVTYGTPETISLGVGERAGVIGSYQAAFGDLPKTEIAWADVVKIAKGRWPGATSKTAEDLAKKSFEKLYKRAPDMKAANDNAAVTIMAYGLRPGKRNLGSEGAAIKIFKAIYGRNPSTSAEWDQARAIAYSGATRKPATKQPSSKVKTASQ